MPPRMTTRFAALHESVPKAKSKHVRHHVGNRGESGLVVLKMSSSPADPSATLRRGRAHPMFHGYLPTASIRRGSMQPTNL